MTDRIFGLYGYEFTRTFTVGGIEVVPLFRDPEVRALAHDAEAFHLTGYGRILGPQPDGWADVAAVKTLIAGMTFAQQQHVEASGLIDISPGDTTEAFVASDRFRRPLPILADRRSLGPLVIQDVWEPPSRPVFLSAFFSRFAVESPNDPLRTAMFRQIEIHRLSVPYIELHHFLAFSALELVARSRGPNRENRNAAVPIANVLNEFGFAIQQVEVEEWTLSRNVAFHEGQLSRPNPAGGQPIRLSDHLLTINNALADLLLKMLPFDDGHINWNRWRDRQAFR